MHLRPALLTLACLVASAVSAQNLEIHYVNVGWGTSVLIKGPDGTTVLIEAGNTGKGTAEVVPYLQSIGIQPANGLDYMIDGHQHCDHLGGLDEVVNVGYNLRVRHSDNGSSYTRSCVDGWRDLLLLKKRLCSLIDFRCGYQACHRDDQQDGRRRRH